MTGCTLWSSDRLNSPLLCGSGKVESTLRADRHVVVQCFRDRVYVNIREFYRHDVTKKWQPGKKGINLTLEDWNTLVEASSKIDEAVQELHSGLEEKTE